MKNMNLTVEEIVLPKKNYALYSSGKKPKRNNAEPDFKHLDDKELVSCFVKTQDEASFKEIVDRQGEKIYRTALRITRNSTWAEDVLQEVLLKLFEKLETFHGECKFSTWLYSVTVNASLAYLRAEKKYRNDLSYEEHIPNIAKVSNEVNIGNWNLHSHDTFLTREIIEKI
jgi:DNA-directed RNA polymerase specialized sigma24 family protein